MVVPLVTSITFNTEASIMGASIKSIRLNLIP